MKLNDVEISEDSLILQMADQGFDVTIAYKQKKATAVDQDVSGPGNYGAHVQICNADTICHDNHNERDITVYVGDVVGVSVRRCFVDRTALNNIIDRLTTARREKGWE